MASYNRVILVGNITRDIELRYTQSGMAVTDIGMAVNDRRKTQSGEWVDEESANYLAAREAGDFDVAAVIAGEAVGLVRDVVSVADVVDRIVRDAAAMIARAASTIELAEA